MSYPYNRIISLVPSLTELVVDLGLQEQLIGRTRFCIHPEHVVKDIPIIGGTKNPRMDKILELEPDLIITNIEENREEDVRQLRQQSDAKIELTEIATIDEALLAIHRLGNILGKGEKATALAKEIYALYERRPQVAELRAAYFIWKDPWMSIGNDTYIHDVMEQWNLKNIFGHKERYPHVELNELKARNPEVILLSSEPYPFKKKQEAEVKEACPGVAIKQVDGQWFSWYGSRMKSAFEKLNPWRENLAEQIGASN